MHPIVLKWWRHPGYINKYPGATQAAWKEYNFSADSVNSDRPYHIPPVPRRVDYLVEVLMSRLHHGNMHQATCVPDEQLVSGY